MDYAFALKRAIDMAFKHPSLWVFGLFTSLGWNQLNIDIPDRFLNQSEGFRGSRIDTEWLEMMVERYLAELAVGLVLLFLGMIIIGIVLQAFSTPALIDSVNKLNRGGTYSFSGAFSRGFHFFARSLGLILLEILAMLVYVGIALPMAIVLPPLLILLIPLLFLYILVCAHVFKLAKVSLVARDSTVGDALTEGWNLFKNNLPQCGIITAIFIAIIIALVMLIMLISLFTFVPLNLALGSFIDNVLVYVILAMLIGMPISIVLGGITGVFFESWYTVFYFELTDPQSLRPSAPGAQPMNAPPV